MKLTVRNKCIMILVMVIMGISAIAMLTSCTGSKKIGEATVIDMNGKDGVDFVIEFPEGKDIKILQLADTQMQQLSGARNETRYAQVKGAFFYHNIHDHQTRVWRYVDEGVEKTDPDLIVLTGDNIYGELDDEGTMWEELCEKIDSYGIPWIVIFGNHDNESDKGLTWQIEKLQQTKNCIFKQGNVTGNSNYNVLIKQGDEVKYLFYLLDTNGCCVKPHNPGESLNEDNVDLDKIQQNTGLFQDQLDWVRETYGKITEKFGELQVMTFMHIPPAECATAVNNKYSDTYELPFYPDKEGDLGVAKEKLGGFYKDGFWTLMKEIKCKGMFVGHSHKVATSIFYDDIRITFGLKTGTYDYHDQDMLGTTLITIKEKDNSFSVDYKFSELEYVG